MEQGRHGQPRQHADQQTHQHQQLDRHAHPARRLMRCARQIDGRAIEEHVMDEAHRVGDAEQSGQRCHRRQRPGQRAALAEQQRFGKEHFLGQEAVEQRHAGHGRRRRHGQRGGMRHVAIQPVQAAHVAAAALVVDDAGGHEQRGLEGGVVDDVKHPGHHRQRPIQAEQQRDQAQVTDGGVRQQALEVMLEQRQHGAQQQRDNTGRADQIEPCVRTAERRVQARQQEHAGLDQRRRVQIGRHRRRRGHGLRQPEMKRKLRRLGEGAQQHQHQRRQVVGMRVQRRAGGQHRVQIVGADGRADQHHTGQQRQTATAGDGQGHARALTGIRALRPEADQQERAEPGQLPEHHQQDQVIGQHHALHGAHEGQQQAVEAGDRLALGQVIARVQHDHQADAQHQAGEHQRQAVQPEAEVHPQRRQPRPADAHDVAAGHRRHAGSERGDGQRHHRPGQPGAAVARVVALPEQ